MMLFKSGSTVHCASRALLDAFESAEAGAKIVYAVGYIGRDKFLSLDGASLGGVASTVLRLVEAGKAYSFQRKLLPDRFEYFILKRRESDANDHVDANDHSRSAAGRTSVPVRKVGEPNGEH